MDNLYVQHTKTVISTINLNTYRANLGAAFLLFIPKIVDRRSHKSVLKKNEVWILKLTVILQCANN